MTAGSCLCGAVSYKVSGPLRPVIACHCTQCRKASGHHVAATSAPREAVEITGEISWFRSSENARRGFCPICGSNLFWDGPGTNLSIFAGTLDPPTGLQLAGHSIADQLHHDWRADFKVGFGADAERVPCAVIVEVG